MSTYFRRILFTEQLELRNPGHLQPLVLPMDLGRIEVLGALKRYSGKDGTIVRAYIAALRHDEAPPN